MLSLIRRIKILGLGIIILGLFYYQVIKGQYFFNKATSNYIRLIPEEAPRGLIFDRKGKPLVKNVLEFEICIFSQKEDEKLFRQMSKILEINPQILKKNFKNNFAAPFIPTIVFTTPDRNKILKLEEKNIPQIIIRPKANRDAIWPYSFSHIVGFVRKLSKESLFLKKYGYSLQEEIGYSGIEFSYDNYLRGKPGGLQLEIDSQGRIINLLGEKKAFPGKDIYTTLDVEIQKVAFKSLKKYRGSIILMESNSGKILAMVSRPSFNINSFTEDRGYFKKIIKAKSRPLLNRAIQGEYPLGSVFKVVVGLAGLEEKKISKNTKFLCQGEFQYKGAKFRCWTRHGWQNIVGGLLHSCNIFFYNLGLRLGPKHIEDYAHLLGLGKSTGIDLPFEKKGFIPNPKWKQKSLKERWYPGDTINLSIGQGYLLATPLQVAKVMDFFANKGYLVQPYIVKRIDDLEIPLRKKELLKINPRNIEIVNEGLRKAVKNEEGTAHILEDLEMGIAGKTGTAQVKGKRAHAWFAGFFPFKKPRYIIVVMLENAGSSLNACKVAHNFLSALKEKGLLSF